MKNLKRPDDILKSVLITHRDCADGAGCALLYRQAGGQTVRFIPAGGVERWLKKDPDGDVASGRFLVFADLGTQSSTLADLLEKRGEVVILDHHRTSLGLAERDWCHVEMDACGTELLRRYLGLDWPQDRELAALVDDRDRWLNQRLPTSKQLVDLMNFVGQERFVDDFVDYRSRLNPMNGSPFYDDEEFVLETVERRTRENIDNALRKTLVLDRPWGRTGYVVSGEWQISELLDEMLKRDPSLVAACQVNLDKGIVSLRSRDGRTDVSEVAKLYNGGGHFAAAGHPLPKDIIERIVEEVHG